MVPKRWSRQFWDLSFRQSLGGIVAIGYQHTFCDYCLSNDCQGVSAIGGRAHRLIEKTVRGLIA